jgi:hypothetical protein
MLTEHLSISNQDSQASTRNTSGTFGRAPCFGERRQPNGDIRRRASAPQSPQELRPVRTRGGAMYQAFTAMVLLVLAIGVAVVLIRYGARMRV